MNASVAALASGLRTAALLAAGRADGVTGIEPGLAGARRSFLAAPLSLPLFFLLRLLDWSEGALPPHPGHAAALDVLGFVAGWAGFALLTRKLVAAIGRGPLWPRYLAVWNWCNFAQYVLLALGAVPEFLGAPAIMQQTAALVTFGWAIWLEWYATRMALAIGGLPAALFTLLDLAIGIALAGLADLLA